MKRQSGMTIVELTLVIVIIAILGALAGPRFFNNTAFDERAYAEELAAALRYAQRVAVGSGCRVRVTINAGNYALAQQAAQAGHCNPADNSYPVTVAYSSGEVATGTAPTGVAAAPASTLVFDALGKSNLASTVVVNVGPHAISIEAGSGLVLGP